MINEADLAQFYGSDRVYTHWLGIKYTDGVQFVAENGGGWLVDAIASYSRKEPFQVWTLTVKGDSAILTMKEDSDLPVLVKQEIEYTDFPFTIKFYLIDGILILPSEY